MGNQDRRFSNDAATSAVSTSAAVTGGSSTSPENLTVVELLRDGGFSFTRDVIAAIEALLPRDAYDLDSAAGRANVGRTTVKEAIDDGELIARYVGKKKTKPIIEQEELKSWIKRLPTTPGGAS